MSQEIKLEIIDDKVKVISPYNADFVQKCRNFRGQFKDGAWWFDDSIVTYVREAMTEIYGTTGETPFEYCTLLIRNYSESAGKGPVELFGRTIAKAFGRDSGAKLGDDIIFISGNYGSGGSVKNWHTSVSNATFEIHNYPLPMTEREDVKKAIEAGWCEIKRKPDKAEIKVLQWNDPQVYSLIGPYAMDRSVIRELDNPITTDENTTWYIKLKGNEMEAFCCIEKTKSSMTIKNFWSPQRGVDLKFEFIESLIHNFRESDVGKLYGFFRTEELEHAKKIGFKTTTPGKNWHRLIIEK